MIRELDCVALTSDLPGHGLTRGGVGTVVFVHGQGQAFEVEFVDSTGETLALATLLPGQVSRIPNDGIGKRGESLSPSNYRPNS